MKKHFLTTFLFFILLTTGYAQDKIITLNNDTIDCKIIKVSRNTIFFEMTTQGIKSSGKLPLGRASNYTVSGRSTPDDLEIANTEPFERLCLSINGGPGYLLGSAKKARDYMTAMGFEREKAYSYYSDMKLGLSAGAGLTFLITPKYGAGIKYKFFDTSARIEGFVDPGDGVHVMYTTYSEQIYVNYFGASFFFQQFIGNQQSFKLVSEYSFGMSLYRNEAEYLNSFLLLTGKNIGMETNLGLEYFITQRITAGAGLSLFYSSIRKLKVSDGTTTAPVDLDKENYENLSRLDFSLGLRFYLWNR